MPNLPASNALSRPDIANFYPADLLLWTGFATLAVGTALLCRALGISVDGESPKFVCAVALLTAGCLTRGFFPSEASVAILLETMAGFIAFPAIFAPLSYAATRSPFPAIDAALRTTDLIAGFDAVQWHDAIASIPLLRWMNEIAYESLMPQGLLAILVLPRIGNGLQGFTMLRMSTVAMLVTIATTYLLPAIGTIPTLEAWYPDWLALRHLDLPLQIDADHMMGIVSFPSFHAATAVILAYSLRGMGLASWFFGALNVFMVVATPAGGYHYLTDVAAGLAVAAGAVAMVRYAERRWVKPQP